MHCEKLGIFIIIIIRTTEGDLLDSTNANIHVLKVYIKNRK